MTYVVGELLAKLGQSSVTLASEGDRAMALYVIERGSDGLTRIGERVKEDGR